MATLIGRNYLSWSIKNQHHLATPLRSISLSSQRHYHDRAPLFQTGVKGRTTATAAPPIRTIQTMTVNYAPTSALSMTSIQNKTNPSSTSSHSSVSTLSTDTTSLKESYKYILAEKRFCEIKGNPKQSRAGVGFIKLNRPKAYNALSDALFDDLIHAAKAMNADTEIGCLVITGNRRAFAAGADISEMKDRICLPNGLTSPNSANQQ